MRNCSVFSEVCKWCFRNTFQLIAAFVWFTASASQYGNIVWSAASFLFSGLVSNLSQRCGLFLQVLETRLSNDEDDCEGRKLVTSVGWAPVGPSVGQLAAAAGKSIHLYSPSKLARAAVTCPSFSGVHLIWRKCIVGSDIYFLVSSYPVSSLSLQN